ncbi:protein transport protein Sec16B [Discoglossus pictus]
MDHGNPPWSRGTPVAEMDRWRGMNPPPPPHHYRNPSYGYYQQPHRTGGHQPWPDPWVAYYSQQPPARSRPREWGRPASRAEMYDQSEAYRPHSRQAYDERYGFYENASRETYAYQDYYHERRAAAPGESDWRRGHHSSQTEQWVISTQSVHLQDQVTSRDGLQPQKHAQSWIQGYEDRGASDPSQERNGEATFRLQEPSLLSQSRESGMSSSSYELSQYMHDSTDAWSNLQAEEASECTPQPTAPLKFFLPHVSVCFGARGQLVRVCPNFPGEGQPALVEIHSMEVLLHDTKEQEEMRSFPGPVQREDLHKVDIMNFCQQNVSQCLRSQGPQSRDDALLWQMLLQMCRQNGCIAGSDVAELLLQDCKREKYLREQTNANLINLSEEPLMITDCGPVDLLTGEAPPAAESHAQAVEKFTKLLFFGRKKEALDSAMKNQLWGHALFLSSKMDPRTYSWVMGRFTSTLAQNDPIQTLFQLMAGRIPQASACCGDTKWGDWRPHLAVMLSNQMGDPEANRRAIVTMGDNLVLKGLTEAGHFCYLTAGTPFGQYYGKSDRLVLLGSSHSQTFKKFASSQGIQRTEILEYCQSLGKPRHCIPSFQVYKLIYATSLLDYGLTSLALHYCECIAAAVLTHSQSVVLITELIKLAERLKYSDPRVLDLPELEHNQEPEWLIQLRSLLRQIQVTTEADILTPVPCEDEGDRTEGAETFTYHEQYQHPEEGYGVEEPPNMEESAGHGSLWTDQCPNLQPVEIPGAAYTEWATPHLGPNTVQPYSTNEEPQVQESSMMAGPPKPSPVTSYGNSSLPIQPPHITRRIRTVSETSTVSVEEEDEEEEDEEEREEEEPTERETNESKKGSSFGWFGWFRSKPSKDTTTSQEEISKVKDPSSQKESSPPLTPTADGELSSHPPPPPSYLPPPTQTNPFSRSAGIKEPQKNKSISVLPEIRGQPENPVPHPNYSTSVHSGQERPSTGVVPLYNPSQFSSDASRIMNKSLRPPRGRYPVQPQ